MRWYGYDNILRSLGTEFKVVTGIAFISKMGDKKWPGVIKPDMMWQDVKAF